MSPNKRPSNLLILLTNYMCCVTFCNTEVELLRTSKAHCPQGSIEIFEKSCTTLRKLIIRRVGLVPSCLCPSPREQIKLSSHPIVVAIEESRGEHFARWCTRWFVSPEGRTCMNNAENLVRKWDKFGYSQFLLLVLTCELVDIWSTAQPRHDITI